MPTRSGSFSRPARPHRRTWASYATPRPTTRCISRAGYHRFIFWAYADDADTDPRVAEAVAALDIRYILVSTPVVKDFVMPDGLASLDKSRSWEKIYDNGGARIYQWRGTQPQ